MIYVFSVVKLALVVLLSGLDTDFAHVPHCSKLGVCAFVGVVACAVS